MTHDNRLQLNLGSVNLYFGDSVKQVSSYLFKAAVWPFLFFTVSLAALVWLSQSLRFVDLIINQNLPTITFLYLSTLIMPGILIIIVPISLMAAVIFCYHRLLSDSEVVVMWATGFGNDHLLKPVILIALFATTFCYLLTLYLAPLGNRSLNELRHDLNTDVAGLLLREGTFNTIGKKLTVYVRARQRNGELLGILVHDSRDPNRPITMMAEKGALIRTNDGARFVMVQGNRQEVDADDGRLSMLNFDKYTLDLTPYMTGQARGALKPKERYFKELISLDPGSEYDLRNRTRLYAQAHQQLVLPLYCLILPLVAMAILLTGQVERRGRNRRTVLAVAATVFIFLLGFALRNLAGTSLAYAGLEYLMLLVIGIGFYSILAGNRLYSGLQRLINRQPAPVD